MQYIYTPCTYMVFKHMQRMLREVLHMYACRYRMVYIIVAARGTHGSTITNYPCVYAKYGDVYTTAWCETHRPIIILWVVLNGH